MFSVEEVSLVQNLVYYVERAYRTPDFGPWGRGELLYSYVLVTVKSPFVQVLPVPVPVPMNIVSNLIGSAS
jgi:hypothetical protein